ncbi:SprA-related family protein [Duganella sp. CF517]|uniref:putative metalloprotease CJM1_0395 family protein n=1 Tax=Duganella sp. CF517 TaxID=1881038 RepID=UPI0008B730B6|nr:putative metalloprotease CJM1_0395 family protein [Duganella sp. CF517]SEN22129.1 SprA-related family protein [Duganella sp. CF517]
MSIGAVSSSSATQPPERAAPEARENASAPVGSKTAATEGASTTTLTPEALKLIDELKARDAEVRQHEQAHMAAAGGLALSGASYTYQRGPNGVNYATGGEVRIDTASGATPEETIARAATIRAAALAPAGPSGADRAVAAQAQQMETEARAELAQRQSQEAAGATRQQDLSGASERMRRAYGAEAPSRPALNVSA